MCYLGSLVVFIQLHVLWWFHFPSGPCCFPSRVSQSTHTALFLLRRRWKHFLNDLWPIFLPRALHLIPDGHLWLVSERNVVTAQSEASLGISAIGSYLSMPQASVRRQNNTIPKLQGTHIKSSSGPLKSALASLEGKEEGEHCRTGVELSLW